MKIYRNLVQYLIKNKITIATAESCTGGLIAKLITDVPGSSNVFVGSVISYSNELKEKLLRVRHQTLMKFGAVSEPTVAQMLAGIVNLTDADIAVAVSGIAGPGGGTPDKPVGTVYIGINYNQQSTIKKFVFDGSRSQVRNAAAKEVAAMILELLIS